MIDWINRIEEVIVGSDDSLMVLHEKGLLHIENDVNLVISTDAIVDRFSELERWKTTYENVSQKIKELENKIEHLDHLIKFRDLVKLGRDIENAEDNGVRGDMENSKSVRDAKGRFQKGHRVDLPRDSRGRFIKKSKGENPG